MPNHEPQTIDHLYVGKFVSEAIENLDYETRVKLKSKTSNQFPVISYEDFCNLTYIEHLQSKNELEDGTLLRSYKLNKHYDEDLEESIVPLIQVLDSEQGVMGMTFFRISSD